MRVVPPNDAKKLLRNTAVRLEVEIDVVRPAGQGHQGLSNPSSRPDRSEVGVATSLRHEADAGALYTVEAGSADLLSTR